MGKGGDKLFQKRRAKTKEDLARRKAILAERRRVLIVCEGEKTEPLYLKALASNLGLTALDTEICGDCDSAPINVVQYGKKKLKSDSEFDMIFFVFDRDTHDSYKAALSLIEELQSHKKFKNKTIIPITSIPCFEIWFLLHFEPHNKPYTASSGKSPCGKLISALKAKVEFKDYAKGSHQYFDLLSNRLPQAKINSANTLRQSLQAGELEHHGNSTTLMHILVEELEKLAEEQKR